MVPFFEARTLHPVLLMEIDPKQTERAAWVLATSDRFAAIASAIASAIAEQFPGWQFGEWAQWLGAPLKGRVIEFPQVGEIAA